MWWLFWICLGCGVSADGVCLGMLMVRGAGVGCCFWGRIAMGFWVVGCIGCNLRFCGLLA